MKFQLINGTDMKTGPQIDKFTSDYICKIMLYLNEVIADSSFQLLTRIAW